MLTNKLTIKKNNVKVNINNLVDGDLIINHLLNNKWFNLYNKRCKSLYNMGRLELSLC